MDRMVLGDVSHVEAPRSSTRAAEVHLVVH
jgi:hypothetical protein